MEHACVYAPPTAHNPATKESTTHTLPFPHISAFHLEFRLELLHQVGTTLVRLRHLQSRNAIRWNRSFSDTGSRRHRAVGAGAVGREWERQRSWWRACRVITWLLGLCGRIAWLPRIGHECANGCGGEAAPDPRSCYPVYVSCPWGGWWGRLVGEVGRGGWQGGW